MEGCTVRPASGRAFPPRGEPELVTRALSKTLRAVSTGIEVHLTLDEGETLSGGSETRSTTPVSFPVPRSHQKRGRGTGAVCREGWSLTHIRIDVSRPRRVSEPRAARNNCLLSAVGPCAAETRLACESETRGGRCGLGRP